MRSTSPPPAGRRPARIFIVGSQRSGTTVMQAVLARNAGLYTLPETHLLQHVLGGLDEWMRGDVAYSERKWQKRLRWARWGTCADLKRALAPLLDEKSFGLKLRRRLGGAGYIKEFVRLMDTAAVLTSAPGWIEKTPEHFAYVDIIERYIPDAQFIHMVRRGQDVVASAVDGELRYATHGAFRGGVSYWAERWNRALATHLRCLDKPNHHILRYEDFAADPDYWTSYLLTALHLPATAAPQGTSQQVQVADVAAEPWKSSSINSPIAPADSKFAALFGPDLQQWLHENLSDYLAFTAELKSRRFAAQSHTRV